MMLGDKECSQQAARLIAERDRRYELFSAEIFDEFPWNMLLHLFVSLESNEVMSEAKLCALSHAPENVGRHWIRHLVKDDKIEAREDGGDVVLTGDAIDRLRRYLGPMADNPVGLPDRYG
ncbi:MAG: hypothetical protein EOO38_25405 [Cytophagaceae bacterium]|nr:MAG: hypothetical protein EOO38_25405 [Cytophagaceae bacterium]